MPEGFDDERYNQEQQQQQKKGPSLVDKAKTSAKSKATGKVGAAIGGALGGPAGAAIGKEIGKTAGKNGIRNTARDLANKTGANIVGGMPKNFAKAINHSFNPKANEQGKNSTPSSNNDNESSKNNNSDEKENKSSDTKDKKSNNDSGDNKNENKGPLGNSGKLSNLLNNKKDKENKEKSVIDNPMMSVFGRLPLKVKLIILGGLIGIFLMMFLMITIMTTLEEAKHHPLIALGTVMGLDNNYIDTENVEISDEEQKFIDRIKSVKTEYEGKGKTFNAQIVVAFYEVVNTYSNKFEYDDMTTSVIKDVADAMNKTSTASDGTTTYTYDKEEFKKNILPIAKRYVKDANDSLADEIFEVIEDYESYIGKDEKSSKKGNGASKVVATALAELADSNPSKVNGQKYWSYMGYSGRVAWCACFVSWVANEAGIPESIIPHSAAVHDFYNYYTTAGLFHTIDSGYTPQPGDLIIWESGQNAKGWSHIGIVEKYENGILYTIEGNSSNSVSHNQYSNPGCTGYASPAYPTGSDDAEDIVDGEEIELPAGLGTYATREFDLAATEEEISYSRNMMKTQSKITNPYAFPETSTQRKVQNAWIESGAEHDDKGFCKLKGRYLIAATSTFGQIGDMVDFYLSNGEILHCILADAKSQTYEWYDTNPANKWGHDNGRCVLEFLGKGIADNPYKDLGLSNVTVVKAVKGSSALS